MRLMGLMRERWRLRSMYDGVEAGFVFIWGGEERCIVY